MTTIADWPGWPDTNEICPICEGKHDGYRPVICHNCRRDLNERSAR